MKLELVDRIMDVDPLHKNTGWVIIEKLSHCETKLMEYGIMIVDRPE